MTTDEILGSARTVLREEAAAISQLAEALNETFAQAVDLVLGCQGRTIITGMGKSGAIGRKLAGTFSSTGTPALFLHPGEALHGDLGMVVGADVIVALSYSGETDELLAVLPALKRRGAGLIALTGNAQSTLAQSADVVVLCRVEREACPLGLAPTTSTTATLALGDALAIAVMQQRGFGRDDYAQLHPSGSLGRKLLLHVGDVMRTGDNLAVLPDTAIVRDVVLALPRAHQRAAILTTATGILAGLVTSGDLRRALERFGDNALGQPAREIMTVQPLTIAPDVLAAEGLRLFEEFPADIGEIPVVDRNNKPVGMLMLKDLLRAGIL